MSIARLAIVLNAHLPFVRHPAREDTLEERWLYEAITDTYVPLVDMLDRLDRDRVPGRLTLSLSPPLLGMLADPLLRARYLRHLDRMIEQAERTERQSRADERQHRLARMDLARFYRARAVFLDDWQQDLVAAVRAYQERGLVEIVTCAATHAVLPLLGVTPGIVRAQVEVAVAEHRRFFGHGPPGFWLPECAYEPGLDAELARAGVRYFVVEAHGLSHATPRPLYGVYAPVACESGVAAFARDPESTRALTSADGYPVHPWYRRAPGSYDQERARAQAEIHAGEFVAARQRQADWLARSMDRPPIIVCAYDAELFGHAWFEGPLWLEHVLRRLAATPSLEAGTPGDDLASHPIVQRATPGASTWGRNGHAQAWLGDDNDWIYPHLHATAVRLRALCRAYPSADERTRRTLTQAVRELLLAQASDWPLLMAREGTAAYAVRRATDHLLRCQELCTQVEQGAIDDLRLATLEESDSIFPTLDYRVLL